MIRCDAGTTNPSLLNRLGDWGDHQAWVDFVTRYDRVIRSAASQYRLDAETTEELCQRVWIDLARRMRSFRYDPGMTFRGWLRRLCQSRAIDLLRLKKADIARTRELHAASSLLLDAPECFDAEEVPSSERPLLLQLAEEVQETVRRRVEERTWQVFWRIAVLGESVREASDDVGMSYCAAFTANKRVGRMLREEGRRRLVDRRDESASENLQLD